MRGFALATAGAGLALAVLAAFLLAPGGTGPALLWPVLVSIAVGVAVMALVVRRRANQVDDGQHDGEAASADPFGLLGDPRRDRTGAPEDGTS